MNGLEAIELMKQGKVVVRVDTRTLYQLHNNRVEGADHIGRWNDNRVFNVNSEYEEYIEPKSSTGWEKLDEYTDNYFSIITCGDICEQNKYFGVSYKSCYDSAIAFSTKEKAEEINFKQTLFRKLQRFSDENEGYKIYWNDFKQPKYSIYYNRQINELAVTYCRYISEPFKVYFLTEETAEKAIELFHDDLIKYFTM